MDKMVGNYDKLVLFEVSLTSFAGEGLKVKFDLQKRLISWNDGYMWNNNFMKAIDNDKLKMLNERLPETHMLEWLRAYAEGMEDTVGSKTHKPGVWKISVFYDDGTTLSHESKMHFPNDWRLLKSLIEDITECSFRLR